MSWDQKEDETEANPLVSLGATGAGSGLPSVSGLSLGGQLGSLCLLLQLLLNSLEEKMSKLSFGPQLPR